MFFFVLTFLFITFSHMLGLSSWIFLFCGFSSILVGAKSAVGENEIKKFLAFTSINQFGFALLALTVPSFLAVAAAFIFVIVYAISMVIFFYIPMRSFGKNNREAFLFMNHFAYYSNFTRRRFNADFFTSPNFYFGGVNTKEEFKDANERMGPELKVLVVIFSLIGVPPLPGFGAKFLIFFVLIAYGHAVIVFFTLLVSLISAYYYLNIIYKIFNKSESSSFALAENYFKFDKNFVLEQFFIFLNIIFLFLSFFVLDVLIFVSLGEVIANTFN